MSFSFGKWWVVVGPAINGFELRPHGDAWKAFVAMCRTEGQSQVAKRLGIHPSVVCRIVNGNPLTPNVCERWARFERVSSKGDRK